MALCKNKANKIEVYFGVDAEIDLEPIIIPYINMFTVDP